MTTPLPAWLDAFRRSVAQAEAEFKILKDALDRQARELDAALEDRLISLKDYYAAKTRTPSARSDQAVAPANIR